MDQVPGWTFEHHRPSLDEDKDKETVDDGRRRTEGRTAD